MGEAGCRVVGRAGARCAWDGMSDRGRTGQGGDTGGVQEQEEEVRSSVGAGTGQRQHGSDGCRVVGRIGLWRIWACQETGKRSVHFRNALPSGECGRAVECKKSGTKNGRAVVST